MADTTISTYLQLKDGLSSGLQRVNQSLSSTTGLVMQLAAAVGGFQAIKGAIKLAEEFENTSIRIAGTLKAFNMAPTIDQAQTQAAAAMKVIQDMAAALPGETDEYISVFATALPKVIAAGMTNVNDIAKVTSSWMALASSNMVDAQQAGMDLFRMLSGQAGADVRMFTVLAEKIGMTADQFNKMTKADPSKGLAKIVDVMSAYDDQQKLAAGTYSAKVGELQSRVKEIIRLGSADTFAAAKDSIAEMNSWLEKNRESLQAMVKMIGSDLRGAFRAVMTAMRFLGEHFGTIYTTTKLIFQFWLSGKLIAAVDAVVVAFMRMKEAIRGVGVVAAMKGGIFDLLAQLSITLGMMAFGKMEEEKQKAEDARRSEEEARARAWSESQSKMKAAAKYEPITAALEKQFPELKRARSYMDPRVYMEQLLAITDKTTRLSVFGKDIEGLFYYARARGLTEEQAKVLTDQAAANIRALDQSAREEQLKKTMAPKERSKIVQDFRNSRFDIKQEFAPGFDPDRVAVAFAQDLGRVGEMKLQSGYATLFSGR